MVSIDTFKKRVEMLDNRLNEQETDIAHEQKQGASRSTTTTTTVGATATVGAELEFGAVTVSASLEASFDRSSEVSSSFFTETTRTISYTASAHSLFGIYQVTAVLHFEDYQGSYWTVTTKGTSQPINIQENGADYLLLSPIKEKESRRCEVYTDVDCASEAFPTDSVSHASKGGYSHASKGGLGTTILLLYLFAVFL